MLSEEQLEIIRDEFSATDRSARARIGRTLLADRDEQAAEVERLRAILAKRVKGKTVLVLNADGSAADRVRAALRAAGLVIEEEG